MSTLELTLQSPALLEVTVPGEVVLELECTPPALLEVTVPGTQGPPGPPPEPGDGIDVIGTSINLDIDGLPFAPPN